MDFTSDALTNGRKFRTANLKDDCTRECPATSLPGERGVEMLERVARERSYTLREEDDDRGQAGTLVPDVMDDAERDRLVGNIVGHLKGGVSEPILKRAFEYWRNVDEKLGERIEKGVRDG